jgi:hypothetical protein
MAAILASEVSLYPSVGPSATVATPAEWYPCGKDQRSIVARKLKIVTTDAGDTATPAVLGLSTIMAVLGSGVYGASFTPCHIGLDPTANTGTGGIIIGTGPSNETIYLTVMGTVKAVGA